jgi:hypothetical protein
MFLCVFAPLRALRETKNIQKVGDFRLSFFDTKAGNTKTRGHKDTKFFIKKDANTWKILQALNRRTNTRIQTSSIQLSN